MPCRTLLALAIVVTVPSIFTSAAQAAEPGGYLEALAGQIYYEADSDLDETVFGLRSGYRFGDRWAIEGAVSFQDVDDVDVYLIDLSMRGSIVSGRRAELFFVGGPGLFRADFGGDSSDDTENEIALHAGLGLAVDLGERVYLRPDVRARWISGDLFEDDLHVEATLALGFRF